MTTSIRQIRIQLLDADGEWFTPHQVPSVLAALPAIGQDISEYKGSYTVTDLKNIRTALHELGETIDRELQHRGGQGGNPR